MAKKYSELMTESDFSGLVQVRESAKQKGGMISSLTHVLNLMNNPNLSRHRFGAAMEEAATTSDFPILLGLILDQTLIPQYKMLTPDWRDYIATGLQSDFRVSQLVKLWGLEGPLSEIPQHGEYPEVTAAEGKVTIQLAKYGKAFGLTWEDILNDRLGVFTDSAAKLAAAARRTEYRKVTNLYAATAGGGNATLFGTAFAHPVDKVAVTNTGTLTLTAPNLATAIGLVRRQVDAEGEPIFFERIHLVVPASLEIQAKRILNPGSLMISGGDSTAGVKGVATTTTNILTQYSIVLHVNPYLQIIDTSGTAAGTWYLFVDKGDAAAVQMNFLRGHETPEVFMKASNSTTTTGGSVDAMEGSFEDDTLWWKVRHVLGGTTVDPRAAYVQVNATVPTS